MVDADRRPTAQEIEELIDLVRRDPASPAFIDLGEAYLALGRPRDAVQVGQIGLDAAPDSLEGRVLLARAHAALHQWKEAQGELLRVVKVDRSSRAGFALLGEVLLRRSDFERAVPVLQHAQNLDPTSPAILAMLRRARANQPLDPPPPLPTPVPPRGETENKLEIQRSRAPAPHPRAPAPPPSAPAPRRAPPMAPPQPPYPVAPEPAPQAHGVPVAPPHMATMAIAPAPAPAQSPPAFGGPDPVWEPQFSHASDPLPHVAPLHSAPPGAHAFEPAPSAPPPSRAPKPSVPPPSIPVEGVRPRIAGQKVANAAAASLRQSAAVGESYLNDLLTGGLLDVAGVRVPDAEYDLRPDRRWGRSTRRAFIFLFVVLVLGIGGGGTWYWWSEKQKAEAVARLQKEAKDAIGNGDYAGLELGVKKLGEAIEKDNRNVLTHAYSVQTVGLDALLYGVDPGPVDVALKTIGKDIKPGDPGEREVLIGKAAADLARLGQGDPGASRTAIAQVSKSTLAETEKALDGWLAAHKDDLWAHWLKGRALLAGGARTAARAELKVAADGKLVVAMVDQADLMVDEGDFENAIKLYTDATSLSKDHPLAVLGRALARAEASVDTDEAIGDLSVKLPANNNWPRVTAYKNLALALANTNIEDFPKAADALRKAVAGRAPNEPRFWARVAWVYYARGDLANAAKSADKFAWYGAGKAEDDPTVKLVDAALLLASGLPDKALAVATKIEGVRPWMLRAYADLDLGKPKAALEEVEKVLERAPENLEAQVLKQQAKLVGSEGDARVGAAEALDKLARRVKSQLGHHALGIGYFTVNDYKSAEPELQQAIKDITEDAPNPLVYRTRTALAEILLASGDVKGAGDQLDAALAVNSGYFPSLALQAKVVLKNGDPDRALTMIRPILNESAGSTSMLLTYAEALATATKLAPADKDKAKEEAKQILVQLKDKDVPPAELGRIAALVDPKLPKELGLPEPGGAAPPTPAAPPKKDKKRHR